MAKAKPFNAKDALICQEIVKEALDAREKEVQKETAKSLIVPISMESDMTGMVMNAIRQNQLEVYKKITGEDYGA